LSRTGRAQEAVPPTPASLELGHPGVPCLRGGERALTGGELHPSTDLVHGGCVAEEEEGKANDAGDDEHHGEADEEGGGFEGARGQRGEVREATPAGQLPGEAVADAVVEEPEIAGLRGVHAVADPVGLDEAHHIDDGKADGEDGPQHADGPRVPHIVGVVQLGSLLSREHRGGGGGGSGHSPPPPPPPGPPPPPASRRAGDTLAERAACVAIPLPPPQPSSTSSRVCTLAPGRREGERGAPLRLARHSLPPPSSLPPGPGSSPALHPPLLCSLLQLLQLKPASPHAPLLFISPLTLFPVGSAGAPGHRGSRLPGDAS
jgi:hypothetical protein